MAAPSAPGWALDKQGFRLYDGTQNNYGAPSGSGVTVEMPASTGNAFFRGVVTASQIQGPQGGATGQGARMWLDFTAGDPVASPAGATPGVSPYWAIADENGIVRVESGLLAALGVSPLQWGMRVNDKSHSPIWDAFGLIAVNPNALLIDSFAIPVGSLSTEVASLTLPQVAHAGVSYFAICQAQLVATEAGSVGDTLAYSLSVDGATPDYLNLGAPTTGFLTVAPPFTNGVFPMPLIFWAFTLHDTAPHRVSIMAGSASNTATIQKSNTSSVRLAILQLGN